MIDTNGRANIEFTRFSYADTALAVCGDTATVVVYNSTFNYFNGAAVSSRSYKTKLGGIYPVPNPPDCGRNNFLMNTATSGAKAVIKTTSPGGTLKAEGNWWDSVPPPSSYFSGNVDRTPYLTGVATPDSCNAGGQFSEPPPEEKVAVRPIVPTHFELAQNYPNPFNLTATIEYALPQAVKVELKVFNILGQVVRTLVDEEKPVGYHQVVWDGKDQTGQPVSSGIYLYQIKAGDYVETKKMHLLK
ncbi:MAG TPA: FlgD immunoglobulin-like domain containing protein [Verrucomicrobiae bacterium]|nr:FlgD immunoglobulin-like domain containing protein [Verrucomicrobiae bacterium]